MLVDSVLKACGIRLWLFRSCGAVLQGIEVEHKDRLEHLCHRERVEQARMARWGNRERARGMRLPHCEEIYERFGYRYAPGVY